MVPPRGETGFHQGKILGSGKIRNWVPPRIRGRFWVPSRGETTLDHINSDGPIHCRIILIDQSHVQREEELRKTTSNELRKQNISEQRAKHKEADITEGKAQRS